MNLKKTDINLEEYHFLITGAGGFIGSYISRELYNLGAKLTLIDKTIDNSHWSSSITSKKVLKYECDILIKGELENSISNSININGNINSILSLAAIDHKVNSNYGENKNNLNNFSASQSISEYELSIHGSINVVNSCIKFNQKDNLSVVLVGSDLSIISPYQNLYRSTFGESSEKPFSYSTVKHALLGLTKYLATYWSESEIRVNLLCPSGIDNDDMPTDFKRRLQQLNPLNRICNIDELLGPVIFLLTDMSTFYNGQALVVDGGRSVW